VKFLSINDENGTPLQTFAEMLQAKAKAAGLVTVFVFAAQSGPHQGIHTMSSIAGSVSEALIRLGEAMRASEQSKMGPVTSSKPN
jgi:hypothetical protein